MRREACWETASTEVERELKSMRTGLFAWPALNWWVVQPGVSSGWDLGGPMWWCAAVAHTLRGPLHVEFACRF